MTRALDKGVACFNSIADEGPDVGEWLENRREAQRALELVQLLTEFAIGANADGEAVNYAKTKIELDV